MKENLIVVTLKIRPFFYLIVSEFFSQFAMNLFNFALLIVVFSLSSSNSAVSGVVIAFTIPCLIFGILAGVLVDRWNKKRILFITNLLRALLVIPLAFFNTNIFLIYVATFGVSLVTQFFIPAETPMIPTLVRKELLMSANALFGMGIYASIFLAYALSGPLLLLLGHNNIFLLLTSLFLIAGFFAKLIKTGEKKMLHQVDFDQKTLSFKDEIKIVLRLISKTKNLYHALFSLALIQILILIFAVIGPGYAERILRIKVEDFPILFVTPAIVGVSLGAFLIGSVFHKRSKSYLTKIGLFLMGVSILLLPYGSKFESRVLVQFVNLYLPDIFKINILHIMVVLAFILGFAISFVFVPANTVLQEETSDESRGKIYGVLNSLIGVLSIIPVLIVGSLADILGVKFVITALGVIVLLIAFMIVFFSDKK